MKGWKGTAIFLFFAILGIILILTAVRRGENLPWFLAGEHFGITLIAVVCATFAFDLFLKDQLLKETGSRVTAEMITALRAYETAGASGITRIHPSLNATPVVDKFAASRSEIRLLQTWVGNLTGLEAGLESAATEDCKIRVLVLNPESLQAAARSRDFGEGKDFAKDAIEGSVSLLKRFCTNCEKKGIKVGGDQGQVMVRLYDATPIFTLYAADDVAYLGFYWRKKAALLMPQIELGESGYLKDAVNGYFEDLWRDERNIRLENWTSKGRAA
jgi:hypothetical protein